MSPRSAFFTDRLGGLRIRPSAGSSTDAQPGVSAERTVAFEQPLRHADITAHHEATSTVTTLRGACDWAVTAGSVSAAPRRSGHGLRKALVASLFWLAFAATMSIWWFNTPMDAIKGQAAIFLAAGRITGLMGGFALLVVILTMARIRWIESWFGARALLNWHRSLIGALVALAVTHAILMVFAEARASGQPAGEQAWSMVTTVKGIAGAVVATAILAVVGLLSAGRIRRRTPYWLSHGLHMSLYVVVFLVYGHQAALSSVVFRSGLARWYWIGLHVVVVACVLWGRVLRPAWFNARHDFRVVDVVDEIPGWVSISIGGRRMDQVRVEAGQYFFCRFLTGGCWRQSYPFSVSAAPNGEWIRVSVMAFDRHTTRLHGLEPGAGVLLSEAAGCFTASRRTREKALLVTGGNGIATVVSLFEELPMDTKLIYWAPQDSAVAFREELERIAGERRANIYFVLGSSEDYGPKRAFSAAGIRELVPDVMDRDIYLCGPRGLVEQSVGVLRWMGVPRRQIHLDRSLP